MSPAPKAGAHKALPSATAAGLSDHVWSIDEICNLLPESRTIAAQIDKGLILKALGEQASLKMNGKKGDHPITDIVHWKVPRFSPKADALIAEIVQLGAEKELERTFNLFAPPPLASFESGLTEMRDRVLADRKKSGWEV